MHGIYKRIVSAAVIFHQVDPPTQLINLGLHLQTFNSENLRELDPATTDWVYFLPASVMETPLWNNLRVRLAQCRRWFIVFGPRTTSTTIVQAMRDGAFDFIYSDEPPARWSASLEKAAESQDLWLQLYGSRSGSESVLLVGKSAAIQSLLLTIQRVGPTAANVLITGESGTGKERVATALHEASGVSGPFLPVNCAAIPRDLIEAELFGAEKGAFTGAVQARPGLVEQAAGGTLFLDEIGELDSALQPKLLRFLESRRARRVGARTEYSVDARIVCATNRELEEEIDRNDFRADLFFRLSEVAIKVPPLRDHIEDLPLLALHFLNESNEKFGKNFLSLEPLLLSAMMGHSWPGNARELRAAIHRLSILNDGPMLRREWWELPNPSKAHPPRIDEPAHQPALAYQPAPSTFAPSRLNRRQTWQHARQLLDESGNDQTWTAAQLGIHPTTLFRWIKAGKV